MNIFGLNYQYKYKMNFASMNYMKLVTNFGIGIVIYYIPLQNVLLYIGSCVIRTKSWEGYCFCHNNSKYLPNIFMSPSLPDKYINFLI